ncbi:hypothetical protein B0H16DRAFT_637134 [Mycena metata]|uniref:Uncharacterized protein n=1 Tax=Mycena metata TaxID=1033252 RepID=A0AAD7H3V4_9AGAR|nr:hypothetical protein B0H16DRAFT_637134 [Mycena metata]
MDEDLYTEDAGRAHSTGNSWGSEPYAGAFFPRSRNFVVEGGVFTSNITNVTHNHHTYPPSPDLQHEIQFDDDSGVVYRRRGQRCARRMYSAKIDGCKTAMTVALYQGPNAEHGKKISRCTRGFVIPTSSSSMEWLAPLIRVCMLQCSMTISSHLNSSAISTAIHLSCPSISGPIGYAHLSPCDSIY